MNYVIFFVLNMFKTFFFVRIMFFLQPCVGVSQKDLLRNLNKC